MEPLVKLLDPGNTHITLRQGLYCLSLLINLVQVLNWSSTSLTMVSYHYPYPYSAMIFITFEIHGVWKGSDMSASV